MYVYFYEAIAKVPAFVRKAYQYSTSFSGMLVGSVYSTEYWSTSVYCTQSVFSKRRIIALKW